MIVCIDFLMKLTTFLALPANTQQGGESAHPGVSGSQILDTNRETKSAIRFSTASGNASPNMEKVQVTESMYYYTLIRWKKYNYLITISSQK